MSTENYSIKIFETLYDPVLKEAWKRIETQEAVYPQMHYDWIEPWYKRRGLNKKPLIITLIIENKIIGIAPFWITSNLGSKILETIPKHFGDFYFFIVDKTYSEFFHKQVISFCQTFKKWNIVQFNQINDNSLLHQALLKADGKKIIKTSDIIYTNTNYNNFDEFLNSIPKKQSNEYRRRLRRLNEIGHLDFVIITSREDYNYYDKEMQNIYIKRWGVKEFKNKRIVFEYRKESFENILDKGGAIGFILKINKIPVAYRMGFLYDNTFVSTRLLYDREYSKYSIGNIISIMSANYMIENNIESINNGVGEYEYKNNWLNNEHRNSNYTSYLFNKYNVFSWVYLFVQLKVKTYIKKKIKK